MSKWESKYRVPFLGTRDKLPTQMIDYFKMMLLDPEVDPDLVYGLTSVQLDRLGEYLNESHTATTVPHETTSQFNAEVTTTELIYFWMTSLKINWEAQYWHLSRLLTLVQVVSYKQQPPKKRRPAEVMSDWRRENERRKQMFNTSG